MRSKLSLAAAAAFLFCASAAQAEMVHGTPSYYGGGADLIEPGQTVWTNAGIDITNSTYAGCVADLNHQIDLRLDEGYQVHQLYPCHLVRPGFTTSSVSSADYVLSRDAIDHVVTGTTVLRDRYRIDLYEAEVAKLGQPKR